MLHIIWRNGERESSPNFLKRPEQFKRTGRTEFAWGHEDTSLGTMKWVAEVDGEVVSLRQTVGNFDKF